VGVGGGYVDGVVLGYICEGSVGGGKGGDGECEVVALVVEVGWIEQECLHIYNGSIARALVR
jgi:hypothetical protein